MHEVCGLEGLERDSASLDFARLTNASLIDQREYSGLTSVDSPHGDDEEVKRGHKCDNCVTGGAYAA